MTRFPDPIGSGKIGAMSSAAAADYAAAAARLADDPVAAETLSRLLLSASPRDPRALLILGSARRRLGDAEGAWTILEPLTRAYPRAVLTLFEYGATLAALGRRSEAIPCLERVVALDRNQAAAWRLLAELAFFEGDVLRARIASAEHARASVDHPALLAAAAARFEGDLVQAEHLVREHLARAPDHLAGLEMLGDILMRASRFAEAEVVLVRRLSFADQEAIRFEYANALFQQQKSQSALIEAERLLAGRPSDPAYRNLTAACLALVGDFARVEALYDELLRQFPRQPQIWLNYGHALRTIGRTDEAIAAFRRCMRLAPDLGAAYWGLANLKLASFDAADEATMAERVVREDLADEDRLHLRFALGKAAEDRQAASAAIEHYREGSRLRLAAAPYDRRRTRALVERLKTTFTAERFAAFAGCGSPSRAPIFVVGLPRSGSTLVEQILATHPSVEGTMELPEIGFLARELDRRSAAGGYPEEIVGLDRGDFVRFGERYLTASELHRRAGRPHFVDKMPNNFLHVGLIHLILPNAKIVDVRRHPLAVGWAVYKQHFDRGHDFSYDFRDIGEYFQDYVGLMRHFDSALPGRVHRVVYEDLVQETEFEIRKLLGYCGLPYDPHCLDFHTTRRAVRTVSSEQVRRPIYREGLEAWRAFEPWMEPLKAALGPALDDWRGA